MPQIILYIKKNTDHIFCSDKISCYIVDDTLPAATIKQVQATDKMVLAMGPDALDICRKYNLDGLIKEIDVTKPVKAQLKPLREELKKKTLGVIIPARRHEAMLAGEVEPEFIAFKQTNSTDLDEVVFWYNDLFLIPLALVADIKDRINQLPEVDFVIVEAKNFENFGC